MELKVESDWLFDGSSFTLLPKEVFIFHINGMWRFYLMFTV